MKFCVEHWTALRAAIDLRGLTPFVSQGGAAAIGIVERELRGDPDAWDPLLAAHWAIAGNAMEFLGNAGGPQAALSIMGADVCPVCRLNQVHARTCTDPACRLDKLRGYDWMIERAADDQMRYAREHGKLPAPS